MLGGFEGTGQLLTLNIQVYLLFHKEVDNQDKARLCFTKEGEAVTK